jgi:hypothetical protein
MCAQHYGFEFSSASAASPELSAAQNCFKMTLVVANIVFLIFGSVLCAVGAYAMQSKAGSLAGETLPQGIIAVGVFVILLSVLGCVAAFRESRVFLGIVSTLHMPHAQLSIEPLTLTYTYAQPCKIRDGAAAAD